MKESSNRGNTPAEQSFGYRLSLSRMVFECPFGRLKGRWGILRRPLHASFNDLPNVIFAFFVLHNYCEFHGETMIEDTIREVCRYKREFQSPHHAPGYGAAVNEATVKHIRQIFVKYFH